MGSEMCIRDRFQSPPIVTQASGSFDLASEIASVSVSKNLPICFVLLKKIQEEQKVTKQHVLKCLKNAPQAPITYVRTTSTSPGPILFKARQMRVKSIFLGLAPRLPPFLFPVIWEAVCVCTQVRMLSRSGSHLYLQKNRITAERNRLATGAFSRAIFPSVDKSE